MLARFTWLGRRLLAGAAVVATAAAGQAATGRSAATATAAIHVVTRGDTLSAVASRFEVSVAALAGANGITDIHYIRVGQRLTLPGRQARPRADPARAAPPPPRDDGRLPARLRQLPDRLDLIPAFDAAARRHQVPPDLLKAMTWLESGWQNEKVSSTGAVGIGQLMPATVAFVNDILLRTDLDPGRPEDNIELSARFLAYLLAQTGGDQATALASYYQGLASVRRYGPGQATTRYVGDVLALRRKF
ncbi:MAG: lytic transglycosylase domain-containing protein [Acidimicrobiales bacterium]